jgi:hypothetical protein
MPVPVENILESIDNRIEPRLETLKNEQAAYLAANGEFWQGLWTHTRELVDGEDVAPDNLDEKPHDRPLAPAWGQYVSLLPPKMRARARIDVYEGPLGRGYVLILEVRINGDLYRKSYNEGPEAMGHDWEIIAEE